MRSGACRLAGFHLYPAIYILCTVFPLFLRLNFGLVPDPQHKGHMRIDPDNPLAILVAVLGPAQGILNFGVFVVGTTSVRQQVLKLARRALCCSDEARRDRGAHGKTPQRTRNRLPRGSGPGVALSSAGGKASSSAPSNDLVIMAASEGMSDAKHRLVDPRAHPAGARRARYGSRVDDPIARHAADVPMTPDVPFGAPGEAVDHFDLGGGYPGGPHDDADDDDNDDMLDEEDDLAMALEDLKGVRRPAKAAARPSAASATSSGTTQDELDARAVLRSYGLPSSVLRDRSGRDVSQGPRSSLMDDFGLRPEGAAPVTQGLSRAERWAGADRWAGAAASATTLGGGKPDGLDGLPSWGGLAVPGEAGGDPSARRSTAHAPPPRRHAATKSGPDGEVVGAPKRPAARAGAGAARGAAVAGAPSTAAAPEAGIPIHRIRSDDLPSSATFAARAAEARRVVGSLGTRPSRHLQHLTGPSIGGRRAKGLPGRSRLAPPPPTLPRRPEGGPPAGGSATGVIRADSATALPGASTVNPRSLSASVFHPPPGLGMQASSGASLAHGHEHSETDLQDDDDVEEQGNTFTEAVGDDFGEGLDFSFVAQGGDGASRDGSAGGDMYRRSSEGSDWEYQ